MDAVASISQRIGQIQALVGAGPATPVTPAAFTTASSTSLTSTSFAEAYAAATDAAPGQTATGALATAATRLNAAGVPQELAAFGNGRIPSTALSPIAGSSERLWAPAAERLTALMADARASGVSIGVTDGYRDYDTQVSLAQTKGLYSQGGLAAQPGTSQHGWGLAVDLRLDATAQAWMRAHASEYGFVENVPREPWHWEFHPGG